ncbi:hypothetical protein CS542_06520 [Pedobacter sp. IW39]|nr:hypothetical protein CS542_06520 [Pedobacter sp. IW39]
MKTRIEFKQAIYILSFATVILASCGNKRAEDTTAAATEAPAKDEENTVELTAAQYKTSGITLERWRKIDQWSVEG